MQKISREEIRKVILSRFGDKPPRGPLSEEELREILDKMIAENSQRLGQVVGAEEKEELISEMISDFLGFGPLDRLLKDPAVSEIMINGPKKIYAEKNGRNELTSITFENDKELMYLVERMLGPTRRRLDESSPSVDLSLPDGSRVNIIVPPLATNGPTITIRKFSREIKTLEHLVNLGTMNAAMAEFLVALIRARANIIFAGATGSGKTTTLNVLSSYIPEYERIITIEDTLELRLNRDHWVSLEAKQSNVEGKGAVSIRELFKNSLRMRPDRIIIGEIRGNEALDMLQAVCSGHQGSLVVLHANSPQDVIYRLETMILTSGVDLSIESIHRQIAAAVHVIVQHEHMPDGTRKITHITQVNGMEAGQVVLENLFVYEMDSFELGTKMIGDWKTTGKLPVFDSLFRKSGIKLSPDLFSVK